MRKLKLNSTLFLLSITYAISIHAQPSDEPIMVLKKHTASVTAVAFSPNSNQLLSGSEDKSAILWDLNTQQPIATFDKHLTTVQAVGFIKSGQSILTAGDKGVFCWKPDGTFVTNYGGNSTYIWSFNVSTDGKRMIVGSYDIYPRIWDLEKPGKWIKSLQGGHSKNALAACFSPNGKFIATGSLDKSIMVWSTDSFKVLYTFKGHMGNIFDVQWFSDNKHLISASDDRTMFIWELGKQQSVKQLKGHQAVVVKLAISNDNRFILSASTDKTVNMWETHSGKRIHSFSINEMPIMAVTLSPNEKYFAAASADKNVYVYNYSPLWVVDYYYSDSIKNRSLNNSLFAPKGKDEKKDAFESRKLKANDLKQQWYNEFYEIYLKESKNVFE